MGRRRQSVSLRVKVRHRRRRIFAWIAVLGTAAAVGTFGVRRFAPAERLRRRLAPLVTVVAFDAREVPEPARAGLEKRLEPHRGRALGPLALRRLRRELEKAYPYLEGLRLRRAWTDRTVRASAGLRRPLARVLGQKAARWLDGEGTVFEAPEGLFPESLPSLRWEGEPEDAALMAAFLREVDGDLPVRRAERSAEGWELQLEDGLVLKWGELERTGEKLARLTQAMEDARSRFRALESADLRFFEDGRILVRPVGAK